MKALAFLAGGLLVLGGTSLSSAATIRPIGPSTTMHEFGVTVLVPRVGNLPAQRLFMPLQATGTPVATDTLTATATATSTATTATAGPSETPTTPPTATPTPTSGTTYPDPSNLLTAMVNKLSLIHTMNFKEVTNGVQTGVDTLKVTASGQSTCTGPALYAHVKGTDKVTGTNQKQTLTYSVIEYKGRYYEKAKSTKNKWKQLKSNQAPAYAPDTGAILFCQTSGSSSSGSSSSGGGCQLKDLLDTGPAKVSGNATWKISGTEVCIASDGSEQDAALTFQIGQTSDLLFVEAYKIVDPANKVTLNFQRNRSNFGGKITVKKPKVGSTSPK
jgi:hypothetical protein